MPVIERAGVEDVRMSSEEQGQDSTRFLSFLVFGFASFSARRSFFVFLSSVSPAFSFARLPLSICCSSDVCRLLIRGRTTHRYVLQSFSRLIPAPTSLSGLWLMLCRASSPTLFSVHRRVLWR